ncbi:hypothetical protein [Roseateles flavus]|uniref:Integrase n=1 Tax=Roseateles flavus TaxID=3149041 RepID=A0ABV0G914_9BURK
MKIQRDPTSMAAVVAIDGFIPSDDTAVTFGKSKEVASRFSDMYWNLSAYAGSQGERGICWENLLPDFISPALRHDLTNQTKAILFNVWLKDASGPIKLDTITNAAYLLRMLARHAAEKGATVFQALESKSSIVAFLGAGQAQKRAAIRLHALLRKLVALGQSKTTLKVPFSEVRKELLKAHHEFQYNQTPPIPARIYSQLISSLEGDLSNLEGICQPLCAYLSDGLAIGFPNAEVPEQLASYLKDEGLRNGSHGVAQILTRVSGVCGLAIITFSGMRLQEMSSLPFNCLNLGLGGPNAYPLIQGVTTKLKKSPARATWVTSDIGVRAVRLAQTIFGVFHKILGGGKHLKSKDGSYLLFCRTGYLGRGYLPDVQSSGLPAYFRAISRRYSLTIQDQDIEELCLIDPFRPWESDAKFTVGKVWPIAPHQLRRSLALYAHASGIVSIPTLKRQLKHILAAMARYYAKGSAFADKFIRMNPDHFAHEWNEATALAEFTGYTKAIFLPEGELFGAHSSFSALHLKTENPIVFSRRSDTLAAFKRGELGFKETVLGGCTNPEPCKIPPLEWLPLNCLENDCRHMLGVKDRLKLIIRSQESEVARLSKICPESSEYNFEADILARLRQVGERHLQ